MLTMVLVSRTRLGDFVANVGKYSSTMVPRYGMKNYGFAGVPNVSCLVVWNMFVQILGIIPSDFFFGRVVATANRFSDQTADV